MMSQLTLPLIDQMPLRIGRRFSLHQLEAMETLAALPDQSVQLLITDPPYESLERHRNTGTKARLKDFFDVVPNSYYPAFFEQCYRVLAKHSHIYIMCDYPTLFHIDPAMRAAGFYVWKALVWNKMRRGNGYHYPNSHEYIIFGEKGSVFGKHGTGPKRRNLNTNNFLDVLSHESLRGHNAWGEKHYITEKPLSLLEVLISESSQPGELVLDPFMGSGAVGHAALRIGRHFIGSDISPKSLAYANRRIQGLLEYEHDQAQQPYFKQDPMTDPFRLYLHQALDIAYWRKGLRAQNVADLFGVLKSDIMGFKAELPKYLQRSTIWRKCGLRSKEIVLLFGRGQELFSEPEARQILESAA